MWLNKTNFKSILHDFTAKSTTPAALVAQQAFPSSCSFYIENSTNDVSIHPDAVVPGTAGYTFDSGYQGALIQVDYCQPGDDSSGPIYYSFSVMTEDRSRVLYELKPIYGSSSNGYCHPNSDEFFYLSCGYRYEGGQRCLSSTVNVTRPLNMLLDETVIRIQIVNSTAAGTSVCYYVTPETLVGWCVVLLIRLLIR